MRFEKPERQKRRNDQPRRTRRLHAVGQARPVPDRHAVLDAARTLGVDLDSVCGGRGICGRCQVEVAEGQFPKHGDRLEPRISQPVRTRRGALRRQARELNPDGGSRLPAPILGDLVVDVPAESQVHRQVVRKRAEARAIAARSGRPAPLCRGREPDMHDPSSDFRGSQAALARAMGDRLMLDCRSAACSRACRRRCAPATGR